MKLKQFFTDDDAVSPVIGVILMVAITVILAAVIAAFVLNLGQSTGNNAPTASFSWDYEADSNGDELEITLDSANQDISASEISVVGDLDDGSATIEKAWSNSETTYGESSELSAGDKVILVDTTGSKTAGGDREMSADSLNGAFDLQLIWEPDEGGKSNELSSKEGPDA